MRLMMLIKLIFISMITLYPDVGGASFKEIGRKNINKKIDKIMIWDVDKNGIKEIIISGEDKLYLFELEKGNIVKKWEYIDKGFNIDIKMRELNNLLLINKIDSQAGTLNSYTIDFIDGKYSLALLENNEIPAWKSEVFVSTGSFKKRNAKDIILSAYCEKRKCYLRFRDARNIDNILWTSNFSVLWKARRPKLYALPLFGDFNGDKRFELLLIPYNSKKAYWIYSNDKIFDVVEIQSKKKSNYDTLLPIFPLYTSSDEAFFKVGNTVSKGIDKLYFIDSISGNIFAANWKWGKGEFEYQVIINKRELGFKELIISDIDNDGLDDVLIAEIRGKLVRTEEEYKVKDNRDVLHLIKWDGQKHKTIWTSKSLGKITEVLVDDVTGDGRNEIIVGNDKGDIYIFSDR